MSTDSEKYVEYVYVIKSHFSENKFRTNLNTNFKYFNSSFNSVNRFNMNFFASGRKIKCLTKG